MAIVISEKSNANVVRYLINFSLRQYELRQVRRVYLNSLQNTPKAEPNVTTFPKNKTPRSKLTSPR